MNLIELLRDVHPFRFLRAQHRDELIEQAAERRFQAGETIFQQSDPDQSVYLLASGRVDVFEVKAAEATSITRIDAPGFFGDWEAVFDQPRQFGVRAVDAVCAYRIGSTVFRRLLSESPGFAQGFGTIFRDNQGVFAAFEQFRVVLLRSAGRGYLSIAELIPLYRALRPAIHPLVMDPHRIDTGALAYAVRRLPDNVTRTFAFLLVDELPASLALWETTADPGQETHADQIRVIGTTARRRSIWEVLPGKNLVLLRSGDSDLIDLASSLCLYAVEARKIRERLAPGDAISRIREYLAADKDTPREFLNGLALSSREVDALLALWPHDAVHRIRDILLHREMFTIDVRRRQRNAQRRRGEVWTSEVARASAEFLGVHPGELDTERGVHIVSSNTHSVSNCLNPWFADHAERVLAWAAGQGHVVHKGGWLHPMDQVYALARDYMKQHPEESDASERMAQEAGHVRLRGAASTGIQVQFFDLSRLARARIDPDLPERLGSGVADDIVINIDYAFGQQAEYVTRALLNLYGENVRSVSFLGKAGALVGKRGDILIPSAFVEQQNDHFQPLPEVPAPEWDAVHTGPMLTVDGTLLQNRKMLNFYRSIWGVVGMEMEGTHYFRQVVQATELGVIRPDVATRFMYYVSDVPLQSGASLVAPLGAHEGIPPLYAITRHILKCILSGETV